MERHALATLVERWLHQAVGERRLALFAELTTAELRAQQGAAFEQRTLALHAAFAELETSLDGLVIEGRSLAWRWSVSGRHVGDFAGVAATGRRVTLRGVNFQRLEQGRVAEHWTLVDTLGVLEALR